MLVRKARPLPIECIVRGYLAGSGWKEYQRDGSVCGQPLPPGLLESSALPEPIFTPSTKAEGGDHDENVAFDQVVAVLGRDLAERVRDLSPALYWRARHVAEPRGVIIADTKFEFGFNARTGAPMLIDEVLTPDSSRFRPKDAYRPGDHSRALTSSSSETTWSPSAGTSARPRRRFHRRLSHRRALAASQPFAGSRVTRGSPDVPHGRTMRRTRPRDIETLRSTRLFKATLRRLAAALDVGQPLNRGTGHV